MTANLIEKTRAGSPALNPARRAALAALGTDAAAHDGAASGLDVLHHIEVVPPPEPCAAHAHALRVAFWNAERAKYLEASADLLRAAAADVVLLCEMDLGMARSGQHHTTRRLAHALGLGYVFGVEFVELGLGDTRERSWHTGDENREGLHGGAILAGREFHRPALIRIDAGGAWFDGRRDEPRIGGRIAVAGKLEIAGVSVAFVSTHLESHSDPRRPSEPDRGAVGRGGRLSRGRPGGPRWRLQHDERLVFMRSTSTREGRELERADPGPVPRTGPLRTPVRGIGGTRLRPGRLQHRTRDAAQAARRDSGTAPRPHRLVLHARAPRPEPGHDRGRRSLRHPRSPTTSCSRSPSDPSENRDGGARSARCAGLIGGLSSWLDAPPRVRRAAPPDRPQLLLEAFIGGRQGGPDDRRRSPCRRDHRHRPRPVSGARHPRRPVLDLEPLPGGLGAEITGFDFGAPISDERFAAVHAAFLEWQVLVFAGREVPPEGSGRVRSPFRRGPDPRHEPVPRGRLPGDLPALEPRRSRQPFRAASGSRNPRLAYRRLVAGPHRARDDDVRGRDPRPRRRDPLLRHVQRPRAATGRDARAD